MKDRLGHDVPSGTAQAWDRVRPVREPLAWVLLVVTAVAVLVSAWQLFGLPGGGVHAPARPVLSLPGAAGGAASGPVPGATFAVRAAVVAPQFVAGGLFLLPVLSVVLVTFAGGLTVRARQVVQTALAIQAVTLGLGLVSWVAASGAHLRQGAWFIFEATYLVAMAAAVVFGVAVLRSQALRPTMPHPKEVRGGA